MAGEALPEDAPLESAFPEVLEWELSDDDLEELDAIEELMREAASYRANPVDVNSAGVAELMRVPFLDPVSAVRIAALVAVGGPVNSLTALVEAGCLSSWELERARPYLEARVPEPPREAARVEQGPPADAVPDDNADAGPVWDVRVRASSKEALEDSWTTGGALARTGTFGRLRVRHRALELGLACEKDSGEASLADHTALSLTWRRPENDRGGGPLLSAGLGDIVASWGQGLLFRSGGFPSVGGYPRMTSGLRGYSGSGESAARRGAFLSLERGRVAVQVLAARTALDAAVDSDGLVTSIRSTGHHRTTGEVAGAGVLQETAWGARATVSFPHGAEVSASLLRLDYRPGIAPGDPVRQRFRFEGDALSMGALDARAVFDALRVGCELAMNSDGGFAGLAATRFRAGRATVRTGFALLSRDYWSPLGGGVPGFSGGSNGTVGWLGAEYRVPGDWAVWSECVVRRRPWRSYHLEMPDDSTTATLGAETAAGRLGRLRLETRVRSFDDEEGEGDRTVERRHARTKLSLDAAAFMPISLYVCRTEASTAETEDGSLSVAGVRVSGEPADGCSVSAGLCSSLKRGSPPSFAVYEPRLPGEFGLRSLNASGVRWYIRGRAGLPGGVAVSARLAGGPGRGQTEFGVGIDAGGS